MPEGNVITPFLEMRSFVHEESELFASETPTPALGSPFVSVYELDGQLEYADPQQEAYSTLMQDLYDEEFDEALFELMTEARGVHEEHMLANAHSLEGERLLRQHFNQLIREAEATVTAFDLEFGSRDAASLAESELDTFAERYAPTTTLSPEFEGFLGKWKKKIVGLAKKAGKFALKLGLGPILNKVKGLVRPLLDKVLQMAIGKLPESLRPAAEQLADRIFKRQPKPAAADAAVAADPAATDGGTAAQAPAGADVTELQQELDEQLANLFLATDEVELELEVARARNGERQSVPVYDELDDARERFIDELQQLREGEDPAPHIQNFLPAILPALRLGVRLAGRGRIVDFLAGLLGKVIAKLIGPESAPALSRAIVDTGLKLLSLEVAPQDEARAAASAVAATVEEAVRRVSALPDYVLDNQELLEGFALEAFEQAAAANLPPVLSEAVYRERPDLLEAQGAKTCWVMLPLRRRKRYKKCGRTFKVRISPSMADEIESFEGPLSDYLHDRLGVDEGAEVEAEVSLYETLPGTTLPDIAREESETPGSAGATSAAQLHPLTPKAAGLLLGEPRMGRHVPMGTGPRNVGVGQRLYRIAIPGRRLLVAPGADGRPRPRKSGSVRVTLDVPGDQVRISLFFGEVRAQRLAVRLRKQAHAGSVATGFRKFFLRRLGPILRGERPRGIQVLQPGLPPGDALKRLPPEVIAALTAKLQECVVSAFAEFAKGQPQRLIAATEDTADGITLKFTIAGFAGLQPLGKALLPNGSASGVAEAILRAAKPDVRVDVQPGYSQ